MRGQPEIKEVRGPHQGAILVVGGSKDHSNTATTESRKKRLEKLFFSRPRASSNAATKMGSTGGINSNSEKLVM
jgi:hypothetical protein